jgi:hypothetical protein
MLVPSGMTKRGQTIYKLVFSYKFEYGVCDLLKAFFKNKGRLTLEKSLPRKTS